MPPTHWCTLRFMRVSNTATDSWPRAQSTRPTSFNRFCVPPLGSYSNYHTGHPSPISCINSCIGLMFRVGWDSRLACSSTSASMGWLLNTSRLLRPGANIIHPPYIAFSPAPGAQLQERLFIVPRTRTKTIGPRGFFHASPAIWNSVLDDLRDPELFIQHFRNKLKTFFFFSHLKYYISWIRFYCPALYLRSLSFYLLIWFHSCFTVQANVIFFSWRIRNVSIDWSIISGLVTIISRLQRNYSRIDVSFIFSSAL